jgi:D-threo-aldose 1-dehydrogenase
VTERWPRLGLGCASLGAPDITDRDAEAAIAAAIAAGIRFFDVAPLYGGGLAEARLGRALRALPRASYVLCTKTGGTRPFGKPPTSPDGVRRGADVWDYSARATRESVMRSLERLGVDRFDVVHLHDVEAHVEACLEAHAELARLRDEGMVGGIGIGSNFVAPVEQLLGRARFDAFLIAGCYTLLDQRGSALLRRADADGVRAVVGGVFNSGVLAAWPQPSPTFAYQAASAAVRERTARIAGICAAHGVALGAAAMQFVLMNRHVATMLIGARSVDELTANLAGLRDAAPPALWDDLAEAGIIARASAPGAASTHSLQHVENAR